MEPVITVIISMIITLIMSSGVFWMISDSHQQITAQSILKDFYSINQYLSVHGNQSVAYGLTDVINQSPISFDGFSCTYGTALQCTGPSKVPLTFVTMGGDVYAVMNITDRTTCELVAGSSPYSLSSTSLANLQSSTNITSGCMSNNIQQTWIALPLFPTQS